MLTKIKQKAISITAKLQNPSKYLSFIYAATTISLGTALLYVVQNPYIKNIQYSYSTETCISNLTFLPDFFKIPENESFYIVNNISLRFGDLAILSNKTCFEPKRNPTPGTYSIESPLLIPYTNRKIFNINIPDKPKVTTDHIVSKPIAIEDFIKFPINVDDNIHDYVLQINNSKEKCIKQEKTLTCPLPVSSLTSSTRYNIKLVRLYKNIPADTIIDSEIITRSDLSLASSSVNNDQIIYDDRKVFILDFNKEIAEAEVAVTDIKSNTSIPATLIYDKTRLLINLSQNLKRETKYSLSTKEVLSKDGSMLSQVQHILFQTSGGPNYTTTNMPNYGLERSGSIDIVFDQDLSDSQDLGDIISTSNLPVTISKKTNTITLTYTGLTSCTPITITIGPGLKSRYGYIQNKTWTLNSKTLCQETFSIGQTAQGHSITAYKFGSGANTILYIGAIHGNEFSTKILMDTWIDELEKNYTNIPSNKTIVVIPSLNIDGVVSRNRYNSNGIDLNRNFPANDWLTDVYSLNNQLLPGGGGRNPLSEPESQALANYTVSIRPKITLTFHSAAGYVIANQAGDSNVLAVKYGQLSGYRNMTGVEGAFNYPITGTYDDWLRDAHNLPSVLIELSSNSESQFTKNKAALWEMLSA